MMRVKLSFELAEKLIAVEPVFDDMRNTVEGSRWHREANVMEHTNMVCNYYKSNVHYDEEWFMLGYFTCLLHDIAKPVCKMARTNVENGPWSFAKHDIVGARMAEQMLARHDVSEFDIYRITWMIDNHQVFWSAKKPELREQFAKFLQTSSTLMPFKMFMLSDHFGRLSEKWPFDAHEFFERFENEFFNVKGNENEVKVQYIKETCGR